MEHMCEEQYGNLSYLAWKSHTNVGQTRAVYYRSRETCLPEFPPILSAALPFS